MNTLKTLGRGLYLILVLIAWYLWPFTWLTYALTAVGLVFLAWMFFGGTMLTLGFVVLMRFVFWVTKWLGLVGAVLGVIYLVTNQYFTQYLPQYVAAGAMIVGGLLAYWFSITETKSLPKSD